MKRIAHLACYQGNIGDNANVSGTRKMIQKNCSMPVQWVDFDILDFEWRKRQFNADFAELLNSEFDLFLIGGGGFFELSSDSSASATPLNFDRSFLEAVQTPMVFNALGMDMPSDPSDSRKSKFSEFFNHIHIEKNLISVRCDGSIDNLHSVVGDLASDTHHILDGGFFAESFKEPLISKSDKRRIAINIAGDMPKKRFPEIDGQISFAEFERQFVSLSQELLDQGFELMFFPHTYKDIDLQARIIRRLSSETARRSVYLAPYISANGDFETILSLYKTCDISLAMRFHANIFSLENSIPTVGLFCYQQIHNLYKELSIADMLVDVRSPDFKSHVTDLIRKFMQDDFEKVTSSENFQKLLSNSESHYQRVGQILES
jgi:polysaccharide pyruvyl transferase WcaK-like protein